MRQAKSLIIQLARRRSTNTAVLQRTLMSAFTCLLSGRILRLSLSQTWRMLVGLKWMTLRSMALQCITIEFLVISQSSQRTQTRTSLVCVFINKISIVSPRAKTASPWSGRWCPSQTSGLTMICMKLSILTSSSRLTQLTSISTTLMALPSALRTQWTPTSQLVQRERTWLNCSNSSSSGSQSSNNSAPQCRKTYKRWMSGARTKNSPFRLHQTTWLTWTWTKFSNLRLAAQEYKQLTSQIKPLIWVLHSLKICQLN